MSKINLTLVNDLREHKGVTLSAQDFGIQLNQYDATNKYNAHSVDIDIALQNYGIWNVKKSETDGNIDHSPFL